MSAVELALRQRALFPNLILPHTWSALTTGQRERIGPLGPRQARQVRECANCVGWLENETHEQARCGACKRNWKAVSEATIFAMSFTTRST